ncbi:MAG: hypothetical protein GKR94_16095 [Gammaproteobacteria bacterium]|nr:hypothetical protein [Gammaproteobacteria bacterium]
MEIALRSGRFRGSEWCKHSPNGPWAACDAYSLARRERMPYGRTQMDVEYYVKFAVAKTGKLLIVSCHPPEERR